MGTTATVKKPRDDNNFPAYTNGKQSLSTRTTNESDAMSNKLWWSPAQSQVEIPNKTVKYMNVRARVGSLANTEYRPGGGQVIIQDEPIQWKVSPRVNSLSNASWSPSPPRASIRQEKLNWNAQPKVNSFDNIHHKPGGRGALQVYDEKFDFEHVTSRVDSGFVG